MVVMIDGVYDVPGDNYCWAFYINGQYATVGIDAYQVQPGDVLGFNNEQYNAITHAGTHMQAKHEHHHGKGN